ncbi:hypothetical protein O6H91_02G029400 [Diphasiastrum complanatum]|uniref:Uncharacterized protein n=1 Tax=Diphasiastrum complanatum TaxID=34168 RepID=A0ACC2EE23_DIPCM|nr:hypothetical protein O6H91_02G029400 [Diphasiastrum complanatum]
MASFSSLKTDVFSREQRSQHYKSNVLGLNAYERHKKFMGDYIRYYGIQTTMPSDSNYPLKTDQDTLRETYRFIRSEEDDLERSWEQRLAKRYHDKLFKEYCIADMSRHKENKVGLRWRSEKEVTSGKGQFICGNKSCSEEEDLHSYEVNFNYKEAGELKQALVKLRVCPRCAHKLNYKKERERKRQLRREEKENQKRRRYRMKTMTKERELEGRRKEDERFANSKVEYTKTNGSRTQKIHERESFAAQYERRQMTKTRPSPTFHAPESTSKIMQVPISTDI